MSIAEVFSVKSYEILLAFILDLIIGDPKKIPHPVVCIGKLIEKTENFLRKLKIFSEKVQGIFLFFIVVSLVFVIYFLISYFLKNFSSKIILCEILYIFFISQFLALKGLISEARKIDKALNRGDIDFAKKNLISLVGRDPNKLDENGIRKAVIESLAENLNDAVIAPLFYLALGGLPFLAIYKTVNTLDSMVGYKNERYLHFGFFSAKMDDIFNYIPARISGILLVVASFFYLGIKAGKRAFLIMLRDGKKHLSPNSGIPEAAMAGALGIKLGGPAYYQGNLINKPYIGDEILNKEDFKKTILYAEKLVIISSFLFLFSIMVIKK